MRINQKSVSTKIVAKPQPLLRPQLLLQLHSSKIKLTTFQLDKSFSSFFHYLLVYSPLFLDQTLVATALPDIAKHFREGSRDLAWIPTAYLVASCGLSSAIGRLSDVVGRKTMVLASLGVFTLGSVLATISKSMLQLIIYRAVTGLGSASVQSLVMIVISDVVSLRDRGKYQGILGVVNAVGNGIGPLLGECLTETRIKKVKH